MTQYTQTPAERVAELLESLGPEAQAAYASGGNWRHRPDMVADDVGYPVDCKSCGKWHRHFREVGYEIDNGTLSAVEHTVDSDGNWDVGDVKNVADPDYDAWYEGLFCWAAQRAEWRKYERWVVETGTDPLKVFMVKLTVDQDERWEALLGDQNLGYIEVVAVRPAGGEWRTGKEIPKYVRKYLMLKREGAVRRIDGPEWSTLGAMRAATPGGVEWVEEPVNGTAVIAFTVKNDTPRDAAQVTAELRALAQRSIDQDADPKAVWM